MKNQLRVLLFIFFSLGVWSEESAAQSTVPYSTRQLPAAAAPASADEIARTVARRAVDSALEPTRAIGVIVCYPGDDDRRVWLKWAAAGAEDVEVRVGAPDGPLFSWGLSNQWQTGDWAVNGLMFYLQDVTGGRPLVKCNTIAVVTISLKEN